MTRHRLIALAAACLAALLTTAPAAAAAPVDPPQLVLRPSDLSGGYSIERNELHQPCDRLVGVGPESAALRHLWTSLHPNGCSVHMMRLWSAPGQRPGPREVRSLALKFADANGAAAMLARPRDLALFASALPRRDLEVVDPAPAIGDAAVMLAAPRDSSAAVIWRSGSLLAAVLVTDRRDPVATALGLAAVQQARMLAPTPLPLGAFDDLEVPLDDPSLPAPVYWLGRALPAAGRYPRLPLAEVVQSSRADLRRGVRVTLIYGNLASDAAFPIVLFDPKALRRPPLRSGLGHILREYCPVVERLALPHGRATIFTGRRSCRHDGAAVVRLPGVVVVVFPAECGDCRGPVDRYHSRAGLRALVRALRPRVPRAFPPAPRAG